MAPLGKLCRRTVHGGPVARESSVKPSPPSVEAPPGSRLLHPGTRILLGAFAVLTALATVALFVLAETTEETFAWTIKPPLTAAFIGAGYAAGFLLVVLSLRARTSWADVRVPVLTIFVFVVLTLVATLVHINRLHFDDDFGGLDLLAKGAAWFWLAVYVIVPGRHAGADRGAGTRPRCRSSRPAPGPGWSCAWRSASNRRSCWSSVRRCFQFVPTTATTLWPWELTPFTGRVVAAWLIAFGLAAALAARGRRPRRAARPSAIAYTVFGVLVFLVAVALVPEHALLEPARPPWIFAGHCERAAVVLTGAAGSGRRAPRPAARDRGRGSVGHPGELITGPESRGTG